MNMPRKRRAPKKDWQGKFLKAFAECGTVFDAAKKAGVGRRTVYDERQRNEDFALRWAEVEEWTTEEMEQEARRRALGWPETIYNARGEAAGTIQKFSDVLLIFMLKGRKPETYRDNVKVEHGGKIKHESKEALDEAIDGLLEELGAERKAPSVQQPANGKVAANGKAGTV